MRHHDPYAPAGSRRYDVPQLPPDIALLAREMADLPLGVFALVDRYPPQVNAGGEWMLHDLLSPLAAAGCDVDVATATTEPYELDGVRVWPRAFRDELAAESDVMIGHLMWTRDAVETAAKHRRPLVYLAHNHRQLRHWSLTENNVTVLVVNSRWLAEDIETPRRRGQAERDARGVGSWRGPTAVVRPPVRSAAYRVDRTGAEFVTLVNLTSAKGAGLFYRLSKLPPDRRYLAVEGGYGSQIMPSADTPNVELQRQTGNIRDDVYARTRVLLMPSEYESWGRVGVEALAAGIPVIAHPTKGLREALGFGGIFLDRDRLRAWQDELGRLDDPAYYSEASERALARAGKLDDQAERDLVLWQRVIRAAATAGRVTSGR